MINSAHTYHARVTRPGCPGAGGQEGFSLVEFLISSLVLLVVAASAFGVLSQTGRTASGQTEVQQALNGSRIAMETLARIIQQAGNDPNHVGFPAVVVTNSTQVQICSDITGSAGGGNPNAGDPDGDILDTGEDITIRYNAGADTIELVIGPDVQSIADNISAFSMQYLDHDGALTTDGNVVASIRVSLTVTSPLPDPTTRQTFSMPLTSDIHIASRN